MRLYDHSVRDLTPTLYMFTGGQPQRSLDGADLVAVAVVLSKLRPHNEKGFHSGREHRSTDIGKSLTSGFPWWLVSLVTIIRSQLVIRSND
jgi:hypothetical protein